MGDISMRGKGKALKMNTGGALPSNKGASKAGMQSKQGSLGNLFSKPGEAGFLKERFKKLLETSSFSGVGVSIEKLKKAFEQAKKMKPTGRLNMDDLQKALKMMDPAKKTEPKIKGRLGGPKTSPKRRTVPKFI